MTKEELTGIDGLGKNFTETTPDNRYFRSSDGQWKITLENPGRFTMVSVEHFWGNTSGRGQTLADALENLIDDCRRKIADCKHIIFAAEVEFNLKRQDEGKS